VQQALTQQVTIIQGPPGTGKTFVGTIIAKLMLTHPTKPLKILCVTYTNHALDDFMEGLLKAGIFGIVRLGKKSSNPEAAKYTLDALLRATRPVNDSVFNRRYAALKNAIENGQNKFLAQQTTILNQRKDIGSRWPEIERHLDEIASPFLDELRVRRTTDDGFIITGKDGKAVRPDKLWSRWVEGKSHPDSDRSISTSSCWALSPQERLDLAENWSSDILRDEIEILKELLVSYNDIMGDFKDLRSTSSYELINSANVIMCTTTGAAKHFELLAQAECDVVLVEEAGEILEPHVLSAIYNKCQALVMIGDHLQLRPKV